MVPCCVANSQKKERPVFGGLLRLQKPAHSIRSEILIFIFDPDFFSTFSKNIFFDRFKKKSSNIFEKVENVQNFEKNRKFSHFFFDRSKKICFFEKVEKSGSNIKIKISLLIE